MPKSNSGAAANKRRTALPLRFAVGHRQHYGKAQKMTSMSMSQADSAVDEVRVEG